VAIGGAVEVLPGITKQRLLQPDGRFSNPATPVLNLPKIKNQKAAAKVLPPYTEGDTQYCRSHG